jgi:hypothetical protein
VFVAPAHHEGGGGDRCADGAGVNQLATGLQAAAEEGIGGAAHAQPLLCGQRQHLAPFGARQRQRLLVVDGLAGRQRRQGDLAVGLGRGQVEHHLDRGVGQQVGHGQGLGHTVLFGEGSRRRRQCVGASDHGDGRQCLEHAHVRAADVAAADNAHRDWI